MKFSTFGTPLYQAVVKGHVETAVVMLEEGCPLDNVELVRGLVVRGCDVNGVRANCCTPFHSAAGWGRTEVVSELIKLGAAKSAVASTFGTPLH